MIISRERPFFCNVEKNPENAEFGWCQTQGDYYNMNAEDAMTQGWGFCSKDCFLDENDGDGQVLRHVPEAHVSSRKLFWQFKLIFPGTGW